MWFTNQPKLANGTITGQGGTLGQGGDWSWRDNKVTMYAFTKGQGFYYVSGNATLDKNGHWSAEIKNVPKGEYTITVVGIIEHKKW